MKDISSLTIYSRLAIDSSNTMKPKQDENKENYIQEHYGKIDEN